MASTPWLPPLNSHDHYSVSEVLTPDNPRYERLTSHSFAFVIKTIVSVKFKSEENNSNQRTFEGLRCEEEFYCAGCLVNSPSLFSARTDKNMFPDMFIPFELDRKNLIKKNRNFACCIRKKTPRCYNVLPFRLEVTKEVKIPEHELEAWNSWYDEKILVDPGFEDEFKEAISRPRTYEELSYPTTLAFKPTQIGSCIDQLKKVSLEDQDKYDCSLKNPCAICFEELKSHARGSTTPIILPCSHVFHGDCIVKWLEVSHLCPLCRFELPSG